MSLNLIRFIFQSKVIDDQIMKFKDSVLICKQFLLAEDGGTASTCSLSNIYNLYLKSKEVNLLRSGAISCRGPDTNDIRA